MLRPFDDREDDREDAALLREPGGEDVRVAMVRNLGHCHSSHTDHTPHSLLHVGLGDSAAVEQPAEVRRLPDVLVHLVDHADQPHAQGDRRIPPLVDHDVEVVGLEPGEVGGGARRDRVVVARPAGRRRRGPDRPARASGRSRGRRPAAAARSGRPSRRPRPGWCRRRRRRGRPRSGSGARPARRWSWPRGRGARPGRRRSARPRRSGPGRGCGRAHRSSARSRSWATVALRADTMPTPPVMLRP